MLEELGRARNHKGGFDGAVTARAGLRDVAIRDGAGSAKLLLSLVARRVRFVVVVGVAGLMLARIERVTAPFARLVILLSCCVEREEERFIFFRMMSREREERNFAGKNVGGGEGGGGKAPADGAPLSPRHSYDEKKNIVQSPPGLGATRHGTRHSRPYRRR